MLELSFLFYLVIIGKVSNWKIGKVWQLPSFLFQIEFIDYFFACFSLVKQQNRKLKIFVEAV